MKLSCRLRLLRFSVPLATIRAWGDSGTSPPFQTRTLVAGLRYKRICTSLEEVNAFGDRRTSGIYATRALS